MRWIVGTVLLLVALTGVASVRAIGHPWSVDTAGGVKRADRPPGSPTSPTRSSRSAPTREEVLLHGLPPSCRFTAVRCSRPARATRSGWSTPAPVPFGSRSHRPTRCPRSRSARFPTADDRERACGPSSCRSSPRSGAGHHPGPAAHRMTSITPTTATSTGRAEIPLDGWRAPREQRRRGEDRRCRQRRGRDPGSRRTTGRTCAATPTRWT